MRIKGAWGRSGRGRLGWGALLRGYVRSRNCTYLNIEKVNVFFIKYLPSNGEWWIFEEDKLMEIV